MKKSGFRFLGGLLALAVFSVGLYSLPAMRTRLDWRISEWQAQIKYALFPPEEVVFIPEKREILLTPLSGPAGLPSDGAHPAASTPMPLDPTPAPEPTIPPAQTATPLPESVQLTGFRHEFQTWNNCGPATLSMALSFWSWQGDQVAAAEYLKPNPRDKNVMPYEMAAYVGNETEFQVTVRVGGDLDILKRFLAAGLPVILEKGFEGPNIEGWMGHYVFVTGYDDAEKQFITQDSFLGADVRVGYGTIKAFWRAFNFTYLLVYPPEREADVLAILGLQADEAGNAGHALQIASEEIYSLIGRDQFFAWFNRGTNLVAMQDYMGAAASYDEAFALYAALPEEARPWRMMWYQTGPYWAYYYTGRYTDVLNLATATLDAMSEPVLEESYYWSALAREALGDVPGAIEDLQTSLKYHPGFAPSLGQLARLGIEMP